MSKAVAAPLATRPTKCPVCKGVMYEYPRGSYCPAEDPHPGGLFVRLDGVVAHRSIMRVSTGEAM